MAPLTDEQDLLESVLASENATENPLCAGENRSHSYFETLSQQRDLPIMQIETFNKFLKLYKDNQVVVVAPASSGDSIQLTKRIMYLELDKGLQIVCTQPRHVVAKELGERVAAELEVTFGEEVGVQYRRYNKTSTQTRLKFVTEGMLLQLIGDNPSMVDYSCVIIDDCHGRSTTFNLLALLNKALTLRTDLKVVIMSATDSQMLASYFRVHEVLRMEGHSLVHEVPRMEGDSFPVEIQYLEKARPAYCEMALHAVDQIHNNQAPGDILVFLASIPQVDHAVATLRDFISDMETFPLHERLSEEEKAKAVCPVDKRKCVVATNIAESSVAVDGVVYVVDCGVEMALGYSSRVSMMAILPAPISKPSADQRAACAGRSQPGICYRLYAMETHDEILLEDSPPSITKECFAIALLALRSAGIESVDNFDFLDPPQAEVYLRGLQDLRAMNLVDERGTITPAGTAAATLPVDPIWYNTFEEAIKLGCLSELIDIAALASVKNPIFLKPNETRHAAEQFAVPFSDHMTELNAMFTYLHRKHNMSTEELAVWCRETLLSSASLEEALELRQELVRWCKANSGVSEISGLVLGDTDCHMKICKAIAKGFFHHAAIRDVTGQRQQYLTLENNPVDINPHSALVGRDWEWVVYHKIESTEFQYMDRCTVVELDWLLDNDYFYPVNLPKGNNGKVPLKPLRAIFHTMGRPYQP